MFIFYDFIFLIFAVCYLPYVIVKQKWHGDFATRFGFFPKTLKARLSARPNIWVHAVSVGEVVAVQGLVKRLGQEYPQHQLVISTVTVTGNQLARKEFPDSIILYAPLDFSASVRSYCRAIRPVIYVAAETEIWPNIFYE
ncbi:MAG TPA: glycosyltransferase N-terminal domain-containing protein, partial [Candidatus Bathyarchaeia archaeon]|nr:glycosyltransferase N-terminal domain-containing protein [Candidatus Bathyarchaeia archaeon]